MSPFLDHPENRIWEQLREMLTPGQFLALVTKAKEEAGMAGKFKNEHDCGSKFQGILCFYTVRAKCYASLISFEDENGVHTSFLKKCLKGGVVRSRTECLALQDYFNLGDYTKQPSLESDMPRLASKNWSVYFAMMSRVTPTIFSRKRYLLDPSSGLSCPFGLLSDEAG